MTNLLDGLGAEEVQQASGLVADSNIGYFTTVSGTELLGTYISGTDLRCANIVGTNISGATAIRGTTIIGGAKTLSPVGTGSASLTWGRFVEAGSASLGAGSTLWLVFPTAFTVAPFIQLQSLTTAGNNDLWVSGTRGVGSAYIMGKTASESFNWLAIG